MGSVMSESISDQLYRLLDKYCCSAEGILGAGISTTEGMEISSHFNGIEDPMLAHAVSSILYTQSLNYTKRLGLNGFRRNLIYTDDGILALQRVSNNSLVMVLLTPEANVESALIKMEDFVDKIKKLI